MMSDVDMVGRHDPGAGYTRVSLPGARMLDYDVFDSRYIDVNANSCFFDLGSWVKAKPTWTPMTIICFELLELIWH